MELKFFSCFLSKQRTSRKVNLLVSYNISLSLPLPLNSIYGTLTYRSSVLLK